MKNIFNKAFLISLAPYLTLILLILLFFYEVIFLNHNFFWRDLLSHSYPAKKIFVDAVHSGFYPLWNQFIALGVPYLADLSNQPLYIFNLIFLILPANVAINTTIILHYCLAAIFTYLFVKELLDNAYIGVFAGICFALSGYCLSLSCNLEYLTSVIWLPAVFWAFYKSLNTKKLLYILITAIFYSMFIFGGEPMAFYYLTGFLLLRCIFELRNPNNKKIYITYFAIIFVLTLLISAVQLFPSIELAALSNRAGGLTYTEATAWSFNPHRILEFFLPFFYGNNFPYPKYWGVFLQQHTFDVPWAEAVYIGVIPFILALCSLYYSRIAEKYYWTLVALISLIFAFGSYTPIYKMLFNILPYFSSFRYPEKLIIFTTFAFVVLASLCLKDLLENKPPDITKITVSRIIILIFLLVSIVFIDFNSIFPLKQMLVSGMVTEDYLNFNCKFRILYFGVIMFIFWGSWYYFHKKNYNLKYFTILIIFICFCDLFFINSRAYITSEINFFSYPASVAKFINSQWNEKYPPRIMFSKYLSKFTQPERFINNDEKSLMQFQNLTNLYWLENLVPNRSIIYDINTLSTVSSLNIGKVDWLTKELFHRNKELFLKNFNIDYILTSIIDINTFDKYSSKIMYSKINVLNQISKQTPRAFIVTSVEKSKKQSILDFKFLDDEFNIADTILIKATGKPVSKEQNLKDKVQITDYSNNEVVINSRSSNNGYLLLMDAYYPGWKAFIDNQPVNVIAADSIYRAVKIQPGKHKIVFRFDPDIVKIGLFVTIMSLLAFTGIILKYKTLSFK